MRNLRDRQKTEESTAVAATAAAVDSQKSLVISNTSSTTDTERQLDGTVGQSQSLCKSNKSRHVLAFVLGNNLCHNAEATLQIPQKYIEMDLKMAIYALLGTGQICCRQGSHTPDASLFSLGLFSVSLCVVLAFLFMLT